MIPTSKDDHNEDVPEASDANGTLGDPVAMVTRNGTQILLGASLRATAEVITRKAMQEQKKLKGDDFKVNVTLAAVKFDANGQPIVDERSESLLVNNQDGSSTMSELFGRAPLSGFASRDISRSVLGSFMGSTTMTYDTYDDIMDSINFIDRYHEDRLRKLNVSRILILDKSLDIKREKSRVLDLKEKERVGKRILELEREFSDLVVDTNKIHREQREHDAEVEIIRKHHELAQQTLKELVRLNTALVNFRAGELMTTGSRYSVSAFGTVSSDDAGSKPSLY